MSAPDPTTPAAHHERAIRVAVVAGYTILQEAAQTLLEREGDIQVVGTADQPSTIVELIRAERPHVLFVVHTGTTIDELEVIQRVGSLARETKLLVLSPAVSQYVSLRILRAGAHGILSSSATSAETLRAIRTVHKGEVYLTPQLQRAAAERYLGVDDQTAPEERLSDREYQVMRLLALGHTNREIAASLGVGVKTIDTHRANLLRKLDIRNNADVARFAIRAGIIDP